MLCSIVLVMVDARQDILILRRSGDNDFLYRATKMFLASFASVKRPVEFDDHLRANRFPGQARGYFCLKTFMVLPSMRCRGPL